MRKLLLAVCILAVSAPSFAISHAYRAKLEREHRTQVEDANGVQPTRHSSGAIRDAEVVTGCEIGTAADYLLAQGWKPNNGDWHKGNYTLRLVVVKDKVVNAQVM